MIVFDLTCEKKHVFEAWFKDSATFERQSKKRLCCAVCGSTHVRKAPMAPRIGGAKAGGEPMLRKPRAAKTAQRHWRPIRAGESRGAGFRAARAAQADREECGICRAANFAEAARKIHYGEEKRNIYGEASRGCARAQRRRRGIRARALAAAHDS